jgi:hypothetical protein
MGRARKVAGHGKIDGVERGATGGVAHGTINGSKQGKQLSYAQKPPSKTYGKGGR